MTELRPRAVDDEGLPRLVTRIAGLLLSAIAVHLAVDVIRALIKQG